MRRTEEEEEEEEREGRKSALWEKAGEEGVPRQLRLIWD
jgi:hypothetical protein